MGSQIWTYEKCYELAASCKTRGEMKAKSNWAYSKARKAGWIQDYTWLKIVTRKCSGHWNDYDRCKIEAAKYQSITEFAKACPAALAQARKNNWLYDFFKPQTKSKGYRNDYERCYNLAQKCQTRSEFARLNSSAYSFACKNKWIDSFDWLIDARVFDDKKVDCVYAYEFIEHNSVYVGRTLMRRREKRDLEHRLGYYLKDGIKHHNHRDRVLNFAKINNCKIPQMLILESDLTIQEGRDREDYWVNQYRSKGWNILNKAKTGKYSSSLGSLNKGKWTYDACKGAALSCKSLSEYKRVNGGAYEASRINGWLDDYTWFTNSHEMHSNATKNRKRKWTQQACYELALTCKTASEYQKKNSRAYAASRQFDWLKDYTWFVNGKHLAIHLKWTQEACYIAAKKCKTTTEFRKEEHSAYRAALKNGWLVDYDWLEDGNSLACERRRKYTYDVCYRLALKCKTKIDYKKTNPSAYSVARSNKWLRDYTWFTDGRRIGRKWTYEIVKEEASKYIHKRDFMLSSNIAYRRCLSNNWLINFYTMVTFSFKGYHNLASFELDLNRNIDFSNYRYVVFKSKDATNAIFNFYRIELQQCERISAENAGKLYIEQTGFYDIYPKKPSWAKFKDEICPIIIYSFELKDNTIVLTPHNIRDNNNIYKDCCDQILIL